MTKERKNKIKNLNNKNLLQGTRIQSWDPASFHYRQSLFAALCIQGTTGNSGDCGKVRTNPSPQPKSWALELFLVVSPKCQRFKYTVCITTDCALHPLAELKFMLETEGKVDTLPKYVMICDWGYSAAEQKLDQDVSAVLLFFFLPSLCMYTGTMHLSTGREAMHTEDTLSSTTSKATLLPPSE